MAFVGGHWLRHLTKARWSFEIFKICVGLSFSQYTKFTSVLLVLDLIHHFVLWAKRLGQRVMFWLVVMYWARLPSWQCLHESWPADLASGRQCPFWRNRGYCYKVYFATAAMLVSVQTMTNTEVYFSAAATLMSFQKTIEASNSLQYCLMIFAHTPTPNKTMQTRINRIQHHKSGVKREYWKLALNVTTLFCLQLLTILFSFFLFLLQVSEPFVPRFTGLHSLQSHMFN